METSGAICVVGSANADFFFHVHEFPKEGETINATRSYNMNGGKVKIPLHSYLLTIYIKGANQAVAAGRLLGGKVFFAGQMGQDDKAAGLEKGKDFEDNPEAKFF